MPPNTQSQRNHATSISGNNSSKSTTNSLDDVLDAARSLLGISPCSVADSTIMTTLPLAPSSSFGGRGIRFVSSSTAPSSLQLQQQQQQQQPSGATTPCQERGKPTASSISAATTHRPRSNSAGLEALAFLATQQEEQPEDVRTSGSSTTRTISNTGSVFLPINSQGIVPVPTFQSASQQPLVPSMATTTGAVSSSSSDDDDSEAMPPPPPRYTRRRRSVSNPEGMEKYGPFGDYYSSSSSYSSRQRLQLVLPASILEEELAEASAAMKAKEEEEEVDAGQEAVDDDDYDEENDGELADHVEEEEDDDEGLDQEQLLRRARSRLLEDLSQVNLNGEKGVMMLPHSLAKYKEVYNKNGHIGIYTPAERAAIIARFQSKRSRRVWNKKIRYNCRKSLADRRLRVKGRFVKRSTLEGQIQQDYQEQPASATNTADADSNSIIVSIALDTERERDADMPDVNDPDAGFSPTEDQPYRRLRRHTIT